MANPANSTVQNLLPVQAYFNLDGSFNTFIGQGQPFYATANPVQSGLAITNSTINSTTIGAITPSTAVFSSGQVLATPAGNSDLVNKLYVDSVAAGLSWKAPFQVATITNLASRSGFPIIDTYQTVAGDRILVKNQTNAAQNGIYIASAGTWAYATDGDSWNEYISAIGFVEYGSQLGSAWYCSAQAGGTLGVTNMNWSNFSVAGTYFAGTGLSLAAFTFSITNTGVTANTYGSASVVPVIAVNAQGQITSATNTTIAIANTQVSGLGTMSTQNASSVAITGGTINGTAIGGSTAAAVTGTTITAGTQFTGPGTGLTGTASGLSIGGSAGSATTATNIAGGLAGSVPYQTAAGATSLLAIGTTGQILRVVSGLPAWGTDYTGTVTSVSGTGTVNGLTLTGTVTTSGSLTLGGTLSNIANSALTNSSITFGATAAALGTTVSALNAVSIGATTRSSGDFTTLSANTVTSTTPVLSFNASNSIATFGSTTSGSFNQLVIQNLSNSAGASTNYVISNNLGTDSTYYGEFGMNSSSFSSGTPADFFSLNNGVYFSAHDGAVSVGSGTGQNLYLVWGSTGASAHVINSTGAIGLNTNITGTTNFGTTGQVLTSAGSGATPTWTTVSAGLTVTDDTTTNATRYLTFTSATSGSISSINTSSTELSWNPSLGILNLNGAVGALNIPSGTTAQRPASPVAGATRFNSTLNYVEIYANGSWQQITLTSYAITYLIAAGGGGGGSSAGTGGGGGGAGGLILSGTTVTPGTAYTIVVGGGGGAQSNGSNSTGFTQTAIGGGGGGGGQAAATAGSSGGSGGGGGGQALGSYSGGSGTAGQGNAGGANTNSPNYGAGGGGGSAAVGGAGGTGASGNGGAGTSSTISGSATSYCGGGGGGATGSGAGAGSGGAGGGGAGGNNATANTGGGGGGTNATAGTSGGSGIVIISYPGSQKGTGGTVTSSGGNTIHTFTSSGTFTA